LNKNGIVPVSVRNGSIGWRHLMNHYKAQILACDFFTIETVWLKTLYVFFFIELGTRRIHLAGITSKTNSAWVAQQARQLMWKFGGNNDFRFLIRDRDSKYSGMFDRVFESEGIHVILTPALCKNVDHKQLPGRKRKMLAELTPLLQSCYPSFGVGNSHALVFHRTHLLCSPIAHPRQSFVRKRQGFRNHHPSTST
jgi:hypothetical protein